jgi:hypothetical protein
MACTDVFLFHLKGFSYDVINIKIFNSRSLMNPSIFVIYINFFNENGCRVLDPISFIELMTGNTLAVRLLFKLLILSKEFSFQLMLVQR